LVATGGTVTPTMRGTVIGETGVNAKGVAVDATQPALDPVTGGEGVRRINRPRARTTGLPTTGQARAVVSDTGGRIRSHSTRMEIPVTGKSAIPSVVANGVAICGRA
jgi:hypothetical protein